MREDKYVLFHVETFNRGALASKAQVSASPITQRGPGVNTHDIPVKEQVNVEVISSAVSRLELKTYQECYRIK